MDDKAVSTDSLGINIHDNPVKAGIVEKPQDYLYSSGMNYHGLWCLMPIDQIDEVLPGK